MFEGFPEDAETLGWNEGYETYWLFTGKAFEKVCLHSEKYLFLLIIVMIGTFYQWI